MKKFRIKSKRKKLFVVSYLDTDLLDDRLLGVSGLSSLLSVRLPDIGLEEDELAPVAKRLKKKSSLSSAVFSSAGTEAAVLS